MLFILTGDIQIGKTRWLERARRDLAESGIPCAGVIAPGVWAPSDRGDEGGFEKLGIDNLLLPQGERIAFARRRDLAQAEGTFDPNSESAKMQLGWEISDDAISLVNAHFDRIAARAGSNAAQGLLVVDELGRLELLRNGGLTSALALLDRGPTPAFPHALIVVRDTLIEYARERFSPVWGAPLSIGPAQDSADTIERAFKTARRTRHETQKGPSAGTPGPEIIPLEAAARTTSQASREP